MNLLIKDSNKPENGKDIGNALIQLIEENLDLKRWAFRMTFTKFIDMSNIKIIYDSEWCRIKFNFSRERLPLPKYDELAIYYGRLHAPNEEPYMEWNGENCHCWHQIWEPLRYLDGLSPSAAVQQREILNQLPMVAEKYWNSSEGKTIRDVYPPRYGITLQSVLWKHYGQRLFELFDLRKPDLWQAYQKFIREYYGLLNEESSYGPPYENIC